MDRMARRAVRSGRRLAGRVVREARCRLEYTSVLVHVSVLLFVPLSVGPLTYLSRRLSFVSFLVLPPLAAGMCAMFSDPESESAFPVRFVAGLTAGALCSTGIGSFLELSARSGDLVIIGASHERGFLSRIVSPPTFELVHDVETDVAIVARE